MPFIIVNAAARTRIATINAGLVSRKLIPAELNDGRWALNADCLDDCEAGQTWSAFLAEFGNAPTRAAIAREALTRTAFKNNV